MDIQLENAGDLYQLIKTLRQQYREAGMPIILPKRQHSGDTNFHVRFSALGGCNLQSAFEKNRVPAPLPELTADELEYTAHVMDRGTYTQAMFQEPFVWYAQQHFDFYAIAEPPISSDIHKVNGFGDLLIGWRDILEKPRRAIVEIKDSEGKDGSIGTPKKQYALQLLGYSLVTGITDLYIVINSKRGYNTYQLVPMEYVDSAGVWKDGFLLHDRFGTVYEPDYGERWNTPHVLNYDTVKEEIANIEQYQQQVRDWVVNRTINHAAGLTPPAFEDSGIEVPITDPLNQRMTGWRCVAVLDKPKEYKTKEDKPGVARANCPYAAFCHKLTADKFEIGTKDANGRLLMPHEIDVL